MIWCGAALDGKEVAGDHGMGRSLQSTHLVILCIVDCRLLNSPRRQSRSLLHTVIGAAVEQSAPAQRSITVVVAFLLVVVVVVVVGAVPVCCVTVARARAIVLVPLRYTALCCEFELYCATAPDTAAAVRARLVFIVLVLC